jgi:hypothetical protein
MSKEFIITDIHTQKEQICDRCKEGFNYILSWFEPFMVCNECVIELGRELEKETLIFQELRGIEYWARKKYGELDGDSAFEKLLEEIDELKETTNSEDFVFELFDVLASGYACAMAHQMTHRRFVDLFEKKIEIVRKRMRSVI